MRLSIEFIGLINYLHWSFGVYRRCKYFKSIWISESIFKLHLLHRIFRESCHFVWTLEICFEYSISKIGKINASQKQHDTLMLSWWQLFKEDLHVVGIVLPVSIEIEYFVWYKIMATKITYQNQMTKWYYRKWLMFPFWPNRIAHVL